MNHRLSGTAEMLAGGLNFAVPPFRVQECDRMSVIRNCKIVKDDYDKVLNVEGAEYVLLPMPYNTLRTECYAYAIGDTVLSKEAHIYKLSFRPLKFYDWNGVLVDENGGYDFRMLCTCCKNLQFLADRVQGIFHTDLFFDFSEYAITRWDCAGSNLTDASGNDAERICIPHPEGYFEP